MYFRIFEIMTHSSTSWNSKDDSAESKNAREFPDRHPSSPASKFCRKDDTS